MAEIENKILRLTRVPPGDRWCRPDNPKEVFNSLTDAIDAVYYQINVTSFLIEAREGKIYSVHREDVPDPPPPEPPPPKKFSIYGDK